MKELFTQGPWSILFNDKTKVVLEKSGVAIFVADTYAGFTKSDSEQEANAALRIWLKQKGIEVDK